MRKMSVTFQDVLNFINKVNKENKNIKTLVKNQNDFSINITYKDVSNINIPPK